MQGQLWGRRWVVHFFAAGTTLRRQRILGNSCSTKSGWFFFRRFRFLKFFVQKKTTVSISKKGINLKNSCSYVCLHNLLVSFLLDPTLYILRKSLRGVYLIFFVFSQKLPTQALIFGFYRINGLFEAAVNNRLSPIFKHKSLSPQKS